MRLCCQYEKTGDLWQKAKEKTVTGAGNMEDNMENIGILIGGLVLGAVLGCLLMIVLMEVSDYKGGDDFDDYRMG